MRRFLFYILFKGEERMMIINSLWKRSGGYSFEPENKQEEGMKKVCSELAKELM